MIAFSNCKINIGLNIVSKRADGYHNIDSLMYPIQYCDMVEVLHSSKFELINLGLKIDCSTEDNLCYKAYNLMAGKYKIDPVKIVLYKKIPFGTGLGAGSSNAAFTIKLIDNLFQLNLSNDDMKNIASELGSDCSFFIENKPSIVSGRGEILKNSDLNLDKYKIVVVLTKFNISTKAAYSAITPKEQEISIEEKIKKPIKEWKNILTNDFEEYAFSLYPQLADIKNKFYDEGAIYSQMSGSGTAIFAIFEERSREIKIDGVELITI